MAARYESEGWRIVARNWTCRGGELDVVAFRDGVLVVCEVKARSGLAFGHPGEAVTPEKVRRVRHAAARFRASLEESDRGLARAIRDVRFDVALLVGDELEILTDAI